MLVETHDSNLLICANLDLLTPYGYRSSFTLELDSRATPKSQETPRNRGCYSRAGRLPSLRWGNEGFFFGGDDPFTSFTSDSFLIICVSHKSLQPVQGMPWSVAT